MKRHKPFFSMIVFAVMLSFFYIPLLVLLVYSFNPSKTMHWEGFSLRWYIEMFSSSPDLWAAFGKSVLIAILSASMATAIGTLGGIGIQWYTIKFKKTLQLITLLPLLLPEIIMGVSLLIFLSVLHIKLGFLTIFIAHTTFNIPYVLLIILARLEEFDITILEAAFDLGARERDVLTRVILPMAVPGILAAFLISITLSLEDFVITFFVAGPGSTTLPLYIFSMIRFGVSPVINALSVFMVLGSLMLALLSSSFMKYILKR